MYLVIYLSFQTLQKTGFPVRSLGSTKSKSIIRQLFRAFGLINAFCITTKCLVSENNNN